MDVRLKVNEILMKGRDAAIKELDELFFLDNGGYQYWDKMLSQNRMFLANSVSLLFYLKDAYPEEKDMVSFDVLQRVVCDVTGCREILHRLETAKARDRDPKMMELLAWFNATCVNGRSSFYENTEYLRLMLRYPEVGDFDL